MAVADVTAAPRATAPSDLWHRSSFGVTLVHERERPTNPRAATWRHVSPSRLAAMWQTGDARRAVNLRFPDGRLFLAVEQDTKLGYLIRAPRFGRHVVAPDGRTITSALPRTTALRWERLFLAQVLPLAAALQGLEVFHASAVALGGRVIGFVGASGAGKTSTAAHLVARGADFFTDDVLALETKDEYVLAHPGAPRLAIDAAEVRRIPIEARERLGLLLGTFEKRHFAPATVSGARRLAVLYFLRRTSTSAAPSITEVADPRRLLGAPFLPHLRSAARLIRHLDTCARVAVTARLFVVDVPPGCHADDVAGLTLEHVETVLR